MGNMTKAADLTKSLWISNIINLHVVLARFRGRVEMIHSHDLVLLMSEAPPHLQKPVERGKSRDDADRGEYEGQYRQEVDEALRFVDIDIASSCMRRRRRCRRRDSESPLEEGTE